jgi:hypothetical protein
MNTKRLRLAPTHIRELPDTGHEPNGEEGDCKGVLRSYAYNKVLPVILLGVKWLPTGTHPYRRAS